MLRLWVQTLQRHHHCLRCLVLLTTVVGWIAHSDSEPDTEMIYAGWELDRHIITQARLNRLQARQLRK